MEGPQQPRLRYQRRKVIRPGSRPRTEHLLSIEYLLKALKVLAVILLLATVALAAQHWYRGASIESSVRMMIDDYRVAAACPSQPGPVWTFITRDNTLPLRLDPAYASVEQAVQQVCDDGWATSRSDISTNALSRTGAAEAIYERLGELEDLTLRMVNRVRDGVGSAALTPDRTVQLAARFHSDDMAARGYFAHESPEGRYAGDRLAQAGANCSTHGENLYMFDASTRTLEYGPFRIPLSAVPESVEELARRAVAGWLESDGHRENMLYPNFSATGLGVSVTGNRREYQVYFVQVFCG